MKKFVVKTLGCKANFSDGQILEVRLSEKGYEPVQDLATADLVIVNSCTVTDEADKQSQKFVLEAKKKNPQVKVIYTGCGAEVDPEAALAIAGVSAVVGNQNKTTAADLIQNFLNTDDGVSQEKPVLLGSLMAYEELVSRHPMDREWTLPDSSLDDILKLNSGHSTYRTRAFIKIQEGCDSFCTYCIIPYGRGPARSLPIEDIVQNIDQLVARGIREVILTGTNIGDYGVDWSGELKIDDLIEAILTRTSLGRLRVSSLDPTEISDRMIALMEKYPAFCPHFHVSLQHVNSKILKLMKRKYSFEQVQDCLNRLGSMTRKPFVGMDYIVGFPGETDEDFEASVQALESLYWQRIHVFPYSERAGTPATKLPKVVPVSKRKERAKILQAKSLERLAEHYALSRQSFESGQGLLTAVLFEGQVKGPDGSRNWISGHTPNYQRVILPLGEKVKADFHNQIKEVNVRHWLVDRASGEVSWIGDAHH